MAVDHPVRLKDRTGQKINKLTFVKFEFIKGGNTHWLVKCDCGESKVVAATSVIKGDTKSCGCFRLERLRKTETNPGFKDGRSKLKLYGIWKGMIDRCCNVKSKTYKYYGARGIKPCDEWLNPFKFEEDMGDRLPGTTLERRDNSKGYCKDNCYWATKTEQTRNRRTTLFVTKGGISKTLKEWCDVEGVDYSLVKSRIRLMGWSVEDAIYQPVKKKFQKRAIKRQK